MYKKVTAKPDERQGRVRPADQPSLEKLVGGRWEGEKGRHCKCLLCGEMKFSISPGDKGGWVVICNNRQCQPGLPKGERRYRHLAEFSRHGLSLGTRAKPRRRRKPVELPPVDLAVLLKLKDAERRMLIYLATAADGSTDWVERTYREIMRASQVSKRDVRPILERLKAAQLIRVKGNNYRLKRATNFCLLIDPMSVLKPGQTAAVEPLPQSNVVGAERGAENGTAAVSNGTTMERRVAPTYGVSSASSVRERVPLGGTLRTPVDSALHPEGTARRAAADGREADPGPDESGMTGSSPPSIPERPPPGYDIGREFDVERFVGSLCDKGAGSLSDILATGRAVIRMQQWIVGLLGRHDDDGVWTLNERGLMAVELLKRRA
jgi:hypothetical protein